MKPLLERKPAVELVAGDLMRVGNPEYRLLNERTGPKHFWVTVARVVHYRETRGAWRVVGRVGVWLTGHDKPLVLPPDAHFLVRNP